MREGRKKEASKVKQTNNKAKQHSTPKAVTFPNKNACILTIVSVSYNVLHDVHTVHVHVHVYHVDLMYKVHVCRYTMYMYTR